ncbi:MAG: site-specific DNA-methyltransferase [Spirochaetaceae bacterium]|nr:site-specific DNA-methyltransferase [Spirochaetaceae bacterium]
MKCIYIDPPYNTGSAFEHYDDGIEHSIWLGLIRDRIALLHKMLPKDGSIWNSIDDNEQAYLKILIEEIFCRSNVIRCGFNTLCTLPRASLGAVQFPVDDGGVVNSPYDKFPIEPTIPRPFASPTKRALGLVDLRLFRNFSLWNHFILPHILCVCLYPALNHPKFRLVDSKGDRFV